MDSDADADADVDVDVVVVFVFVLPLKNVVIETSRVPLPLVLSSSCDEEDDLCWLLLVYS